MSSYKIKKIVTNNLIRGIDRNSNHVILLGKGIGYNKKTNDIISSSIVEQVYTLVNEKEVKIYDELITTTSPKLVELSNQIITFIQSNFDTRLDEHIHTALTDHFSFLVKRSVIGVPLKIENNYEIESLYPKETTVARKALEMLKDQLNIIIPEGETFLLAMHIISSLNSQSIESVQRLSIIVDKIIKLIECESGLLIDKKSLNYARLCIHLRFLIERIERNEPLTIPNEILKIIKNDYPHCYSLSWRIAKFIQQNMNKYIPETEIVSLCLHLYRFMYYDDMIL